MNKPAKLVLLFAVATVAVVSLAATSTPSENSVRWEYRVVKENLAIERTMTDVLNRAGARGWEVDAFSSHSTGNAEMGVIILKRRVSNIPAPEPKATP